jgi:hypothetical protein
MNHILSVAAATTAFGLLGFMLTAVLIVSRASRREDKNASLSGPARGRAAPAIRRLLAVDPGGFIFSLPPDQGWRAVRPLLLLVPGAARRRVTGQRQALPDAGTRPPGPGRPRDAETAGRPQPPREASGEQPGGSTRTTRRVTMWTSLTTMTTVWTRSDSYER